MQIIRDEQTLSYRIGVYTGRTLAALIFFTLLYFIAGRVLHLRGIIAYPIYILTIFLVALILIAMTLTKKQDIKIAENVVN